MAARAGLREGDIILSINGTPVRDATQMRSLLGNRSEVALRIKRGDATIFLPLELG